MALERKFLKALGIEPEKIEEIIEKHTETVDGLKGEIDKYKAEAEKVPGLQAEVESLKGADNPFEKKYNDLQAEFDQYKADQKIKETNAAKTAAYKKLLKDSGVSEKRFDAILRLTDLNGIELGEDGSIKDSDKHSESIKTEWSEYIVTEGKKGADVSNPPTKTAGNDFDKMSLVDKMKYANEHPEDASVKEWLEQ